jgi:hypothetical protein
MKINVVAIFLFAGMIACKSDSPTGSENTNPENKLIQANFLLGKWESNHADVHITEIWESEGEAYLGRSYSMRGTDTLSSERIKLQQEGNQLVYIPMVKDQNQGQIVKFVLTSSDSNRLIFENPQHDFPQRILYTEINKDSLLAEISGILNGKEAIEKFPMHRIH